MSSKKQNVRKFRLAAMALALQISTGSAFAAITVNDTFVFRFANGGAKATGSISLNHGSNWDTGSFVNPAFGDVTALNVTVSGASAGNGSFTRANFNSVAFNSNGALNRNANFVGQTNFRDFNVFGTGSPAPNGSSPFILAADNGFGTGMTLDCFYLQGVGSCGAPAPAAGQFVPNSSPRTNSVAAVLDSLNGGTGSMATAITALAGLSAPEQSAALEKLTPSPSRGLQVTTTNSMFSAFNQIGLRLDGLRLANGSFSSPVLAQGDGFSTGLASGDEPAKRGLWIKAYGLEGRQGQKDGYAGYKNNGWGMVAGIDQEFAPGLIAGVALTYSDASLSYRDQLSGSGNDAKSVQASLYGTKDFGRFYVDGAAAYGQQRNTSSRDTVVSGTAMGKFDGDQWGVRLGAGMPIPLSRDLNLVPQARLEWLRVHQDAYTETDSALALNVDATTAQRIRSGLGAQLNYDTVLGSVKAQPYLKAFWNYDFKNSGIDSSASFVGGGTSFTTQGQKLDRNTYTLGLGANLFTRNNFTASIGYDFTGASSYQSHIAQTTLRWAF